MRSPKITGVVEIHVHKSELHDGARNLRAKTQRDPLVRLDVNDKLICARIFDRSFTEQHKRRAAEVDRNFGYTLGQPFAGAKIKWHIAPTPVIDFQLQRDKSFRVGVGRDIRLAAIGGKRLPVDHPFAVLAAHHVLQNFLRCRHLNRMQDFGLFVTHRVGFERNRRLHGRQSQELKKMIRHHVAQRACRLVKRSTVFHTDRFSRGDLHVVDVGAVPEWFDDAVCEPEHHHVLNGFFTEVVVDTVDLLLAQDLFQLFVQLNR